MKLDALLAAMDSMAVEKPRAVFIKGLGDVHIREITIGEIDAQIADTDKKDKMSLVRSACRLLSDEDGNRLLDPENAEHVARMAKLPLRVLTAINKAAELDEAQAGGKLTWREEFQHILALELGWSVAELSRRMTEREFRRWMRFASQRALPSQRLEIYLAQIASVVAQSVGNELTIKDFLLDFGGRKAKPAKEDVRAIAAWLPAGRVVKGKLRKKKALNG